MEQLIQRDFRKKPVSNCRTKSLEQMHFDDCFNYINARISIDHQETKRWLEVKEKVTKLYSRMKIYDIGF